MNNSSRKKIVDALIAAADTLVSGNYRDAQTAVRRVLKKVRPAKNKAGTVRVIADALTSDPVFMNLVVTQDAHGGDAFILREWLGEPLMGWREDNEVDGPDFDELTFDVMPLVKRAAAKWKPTQDKELAPPFDLYLVGQEARALMDLVNQLERLRSHEVSKDVTERRERYVNEVKEHVNKIADAVGLKTS